MSKLTPIVTARTPEELHKASWDYLFPQGLESWYCVLQTEDTLVKPLVVWKRVLRAHTGEVLPGAVLALYGGEEKALDTPDSIRERLGIVLAPWGLSWTEKVYLSRAPEVVVIPGFCKL